jgi:hypothetical protein
MSRVEAIAFAAKQVRSAIFKLVPMRYRRSLHRRLSEMAYR